MKYLSWIIAIGLCISVLMMVVDSQKLTKVIITVAVILGVFAALAYVLPFVITLYVATMFGL